jgi:hypothetical protein
MLFISFLLLSSASSATIPVVTVSLDNLENVSATQKYYSGNIFVGSPTQKLQVIFDVGSAVLCT